MTEREYMPTTEEVAKAWGYIGEREEFDAWLEKVRGEAKAEAMDSLLEYGYPYHPDAHSPLLTPVEGATIADEWWRKEFALRARVYRGEEEYR